MSRLQKKPPAHKRGHPTLQNMEFFLLLWAIFALLDPDPDPYSNYGSGSNVPIEYGSNTDPDPKPCVWVHRTKRPRRLIKLKTYSLPLLRKSSVPDPVKTVKNI